MKIFAILILPALILSTLIFFGACAINSSTANKILAPVTPITLTAVSAKFHTSSDDKDDDTKFDMALRSKDNKVIAEAKNVFGKYEENSDHSVPFEKKGNFGKTDLDQSKFSIHIMPDGSDQWDFNLTLEFKFSDGTTVLSKPLNGNVMTEKNPDLDLAVEMADR
jgi:hypothetical protein